MNDTPVIQHESPVPGVTMAGMPQTPAHAKRSARRDHLWVLAVIAGFALFDVWESWTQVGNKSGFAHGTGWTLTVIVEAYAGYALFAWFGAPGVRSRRFAMWSAFAVLALSLVGQGSSSVAAHAMPPTWLAVFVKDLPVVVLALIALLIHVRRLDREDAAEAVRRENEAACAAAEEAAAADDRATLRADLEAAHAALEAAERARDVAQQEAAQATAKADAAARKLAAQKPKRTRTTGPDAAKRTPSRAAHETTDPMTSTPARRRSVSGSPTLISAARIWVRRSA